jgi:cystathionine beta-lyase/cystathionine gamma-synthase
MTDAHKMHRFAMELTDRALEARHAGNAAGASELFRQAFEQEHKALRALMESENNTEPTRSVLCRSAASLALESGLMEAARDLVRLGLEGSPPRPIRQELEELQKSIAISHSSLSVTKPIEAAMVEAEGRSPKKIQKAAFETGMTHHKPVGPRTAVLTRGFDASLSVGSARPAVFRNSAFVFESPEAAERAFAITTGKIQPDKGMRADLIYSRFSHPNAEILEDQIVPLEAGARHAAVFNSGMAAITTALFAYARPNSAIIYTTPLYGGTTDLIRGFLAPLGVTGTPVPPGDSDALETAIRNARDLCIVLLETPANPTMIMLDIERAASAAAGRPDRPVVMVDNTLLGPTFQHPLLLGADLCLYSATKYLSGYSDMLGGVAITASEQMIRKIRGARGMFGNILQPDECWILDGRLSTVVLRMNRQSKNAQRIAEALVGHRALSRVIYPTVFADPEQKRIFEKQCDLPGGMLSIEFNGGKEAAFDFLRRMRIARTAISLGGVETVVCHPKSTTHAGMTAHELAESGVTDGLVRISVGIEDWRDLLADFEQALVHGE